MLWVDLGGVNACYKWKSDHSDKTVVFAGNREQQQQQQCLFNTLSFVFLHKWNEK